MENQTVQVISTFPTREQAIVAGEQAVNLLLAACAQISSEILSIYTWEGRVCKSTEFQLILKTTVNRENELVSWLRKIHPYEVAEIISIPLSHVSSDYLAWMQQVTKTKQQTSSCVP
jgi:periplasmic divalent cation tolerance protein